MALRTDLPNRPPSLSFSSSTLFLSRVVSGFFSIFFLCVLIYTIQVDGSPFRRELLTPWMNTTLVDYYLTLAPLCLWGAYRERGLFLRQVFVVLFLCCLGSCAVWAYIYYVLTKLKGGDPVHKLIG